MPDIERRPDIRLEPDIRHYKTPDIRPKKYPAQPYFHIMVCIAAG